MTAADVWSAAIASGELAAWEYDGIMHLVVQASLAGLAHRGRAAGLGSETWLT